MKILIVDDNLSNLFPMKTVLENNGYDVAEATNGENALKVLRAEKIDLIISDILMPVMDGYHLCQECKSDESLKHIPFIFCSGTYTDEKDENLSIQFGAEAFITKPFNTKQLMATVTRVLEDSEKGKINIPELHSGDNKGVYKLYSERLINKLEEKMLDLDKEKMALEMEVAERRKVEEELRKSNDFAESLLNAAPGIVLILDTEGRIVRFNPYMEMVSGYSLNDVKGQSWVDVFSPEGTPLRFPDESSSNGSREISMGNVASITTKSGDKKRIMWFDSTLKDDSGKIIGLLAVGQDITRQVQIQKETFQARTHEAIGNFSDDVARELDEITNAMFESISLLEKEISDDPQKQNHLKAIRTAAQRAKELTGRLPQRNKKK